MNGWSHANSAIRQAPFVQRRLGSCVLRGVRVAILFVAAFASTAEALSLVYAVSRKLHGPAGIFDLPIQPAASITGPVSIEPRAAGSGHVLVFTFDEPLTAAGTVTVADANGSPVGNATALVMNGSTVEVTIADAPDRRRVNVTLTGVMSAGGSANATIFLGLLVGDFNDSASVSPLDVSACKARAGRPVDAGSFRFDINASGYVSVVDIVTTKSHLGTSMVTGQPLLTWQQGGWDLDVWQ